MTPRPLAYALAVLLPLAALVLRDSLAISFGDRSLLILFIMPVIITALLGGLAPGLVATAIAALCAAWRIPPDGSLAMAANHDVIQLMLMVADGVLVSAMSEALHRAQGTLREREHRLEAIIGYSPSALSLKHPDGRYALANPNLQRIHHLSEAEIIGKTDFDLYPEATARAFQANDRRVLETMARHSIEEIVPVDGVPRAYMSHMFPVLDDAGKAEFICRISLDITDRKQAEQALRENQAAALERQQQARLAALNRMEDANAARRAAEAAEAEVRQLNLDLERRVAERTAELSAANRELDSFAYAVSHDLRAPLRAMSGFARALAEDCGDQLHGEAQVYLEQIDIAGRRMNDLVDGILALSRITRGELQRGPVDLSALAVRLLEELARQEPERRVVWQVAPGLGVRGDARMLEAALGNLLGNAWKYSGKAAAAEIRVHAEERDGRRWICVADNGAGFDPAHAARLFQPFQRLHRQEEFPGIGIGLATVARIIHRHGGAIEARGEPGQGASFCFTLPTGAEDQT